MLPDLDTAVDAESVKENLQAVQAIYFAYMLEEMRVYQVVERIAQLFQQGLLPAAEGSAAKLLRQRVLEPSRLSALERGQLYSRVLGARDAPSGTARAVEPNRMFLSLWLRFVVSVAVYARQHDANSLLAPHAAGCAIRRS